VMETLKQKALNKYPHKIIQTIKWDGHIPKRRYAMFTDITHGEYMAVIRGNDILTAPKWGGFVKWIGGIRPSETRQIHKGKYTKEFLYVNKI